MIWLVTHAYDYVEGVFSTREKARSYVHEQVARGVDEIGHYQVCGHTVDAPDTDVVSYEGEEI